MICVQEAMILGYFEEGRAINGWILEKVKEVVENDEKSREKAESKEGSLKEKRMNSQVERRNLGTWYTGYAIDLTLLSP
jgi:hypothetical protein